MASTIDLFTRLHRAKHLLSHVLAAAGAEHWPGAALGSSGETKTGFFADFSFPPLPTEEEISQLTHRMTKALGETRRFRPLELRPQDALARFRLHPWKRFQIEAIAEGEPSIQAFELNGFVDVCDCALKNAAHLADIHPEKFLLTGAETVVWSHRGRDELFVRVRGELFPLPPPCECC